jgi:hypothetical protein
MPFNGAGSFTSLGAPTFPAVPGELILANYFNATLNDVFAGLSVVMTRDGQGGPTANISWGGFKLTGLGAATVAGDAVRFEQVVLKTSDTGSAVIPKGTTAQRDGTPVEGYLRYNSTTKSFEGYAGAIPAWGSIGGDGGGGGATGGGTDQTTYENDTFGTASYTLGQAAINIACTFSNGSATVTAANTFVAGQPIRFVTTGTLPTNFDSTLSYFVIATGLTTSAFQCSLTVGGSAVVAGSAGSGTHTTGKIKNGVITGPYTQADGTTYTVPTGATLVIL